MILSFTPDYLDRLRAVSAFDEQAMFAPVNGPIDLNGVPERIRTMLVTPSWFGLVRAKPFLGRAFNEDEARGGNELKAVLSHAMWQQLFAGDPAAIGRDLIVSGRRLTVIGVLPRDFFFVNPDVQLWIPMVFSDELPSWPAH